MHMTGLFVVATSLWGTQIGVPRYPVIEAEGNYQGEVTNVVPERLGEPCGFYFSPISLGSDGLPTATVDETSVKADRDPDGQPNCHVMRGQVELDAERRVTIRVTLDEGCTTPLYYDAWYFIDDVVQDQFTCANMVKVQ